MAKKYDVLVLGANPDGLVAAATLAKAGRSVLVVEASAEVGGAWKTVEVGGLRAPAVHASIGRLHPDLVQSLDLERHGLKRLGGRGVFVAAAEGEEPLWINTGIDGGASSVEADAVADFDGFLRRVAAALEPALTKALPKLEPSGAGDFFELLTLGWRMRKLGKAEMPEALRYLPMPLRDVLDERFHDERLKAAIAGPALLGTWLAPRSAGTAMTLLWARPSWTPPGALTLAPPVFAEGGPGKLAEALAAAAKARGAEIRLGAAVESIRIDDGRVGGIVLEGGEEIAAGAVLSSLDPKRTLLQLAGARHLDPDHVFQARAIRQRGTTAIVHLVVDALPSFRGAPAPGQEGGDAHLRGRIQIGSTLDALERAFDAVKYGEIPADPFLTISVPSLVDPSLAAGDGKHILHVWAQSVPYTLAEGTWDDRRDELGDVVVQAIEKRAPGFAATVKARKVTTPLDLERDHGLPGGCVDHAELALDQALYMRPLPGWSRYRMPIDGLWTCGPGSHPGGGLIGLSGRAAAGRIVAEG